jgi:hypothetical protein
MDAAGREVLGVLGRGDEESKGCAGFCPSSSTNILLCQNTEFAEGTRMGSIQGLGLDARTGRSISE